MQGSLAHRNGVLYVGRYAKTAWVAAYDLDGRSLKSSFAFRDEAAGRSTASGLAVDADHRVWVADEAAGRVRAFTLFGAEVVSVADPEDCDRGADVLGRLGAPVDVAVAGEDEELVLAVACKGRRRHALQLFRAHAGAVRSVRPRGDPRGTFAHLRGLAFDGEVLYACEGGTGRIHVHRAGAHVFDFGLPVNGGRSVEPVAVDLLPDGRSVVAVAGEVSSVLVFDAAGRPRGVLATSDPGADPDAVGTVDQPGDVVVVPGADDRHTRVFVVDRDGERVQAFNLEGRCHGAFPRWTGS